MVTLPETQKVKYLDALKNLHKHQFITTNLTSIPLSAKYTFSLNIDFHSHSYYPLPDCSHLLGIQKASRQAEQPSVSSLGAHQPSLFRAARVIFPK